MPTEGREPLLPTPETQYEAEVVRLRSQVSDLTEQLEQERQRSASLESDLEDMVDINTRLARQRFTEDDEIDVRDQIIATLELERSRDSMTGLLCKEAWLDNVEEMIAHKEEDFGILFIDLSNFKRINDDPRLGHLAGDRLIKKTAEVLQNTLRGQEESQDIVAHERLHKSPDVLDEDTDVSRYGGDEFAVLCDLHGRSNPSFTKEDRLNAVISRLRDKFDEMLAEEEPRVREHGFDLAIGGSIYEPGMSLEDLLKQADKAMYADKFERKAAWQEQRPVPRRAAHTLGRMLLRYAKTLDERRL